MMKKFVAIGASVLMFGAMMVTLPMQLQLIKLQQRQMQLL